MRDCLAFFVYISCVFSIHIIPLDPLSEFVAFEQVKEDGLQFKLRVDLNLPSKVVFRVYEPEELHDDYSMGKKDFNRFSLRKDYFYDKKGLYTIKITNMDTHPVLVMLKSVVDKPYGTDDDFSELRRSLAVLENELESTHAANVQLKEMKEEHIKEARVMLRKLLVLCVLPLGYVGIGFVKLKKMKMFFQPKS